MIYNQVPLFHVRVSAVPLSVVCLGVLYLQLRASMRANVHVNWCMNVCQCVLCMLSSLSRLLCIFSCSQMQRGEPASQTHPGARAQVRWTDKTPCVPARGKQSPLVQVSRPTPLIQHIMTPPETPNCSPSPDLTPSPLMPTCPVWHTLRACQE